jgi:hypothetical protein
MMDFTKTGVTLMPTMKEWFTAPELWFGPVTFREKLWNATRLRLFSTGDDAWVPNRYRLIGFKYTHDYKVYGLVGFHLFMRFHWWWIEMGHRWCLERWGIKVGLFQVDTEAGYYKNVIWRWPNGHRRCPADWPAWKQRKYHPANWADDPPKE